MLAIKTLKKFEFFLAGLLFFFLPTQLAYFFWPSWSFFWGIRVDFLSPTIFFTDIIIFFLLLFWLLRLALESSFWLEKKASWRLILASVFLLLIGVFLAYRPLLAGYRLIKWLEFCFLIIYFRKNFLPVFLLPLFFSLLLTSFLSWGQLLYQRSFQGFFWWLGERSFNLSTIGVAKMTLFDRLFVQPMATFSHANSLAGFVLVSLVIFWRFRSFFTKKLGKLFYLGLSIIGSCLIITFSGTVWLTIMVAGLLFWLKKLGRWWFFLISGFLLAVFTWLMLSWEIVAWRSVLERQFLLDNAWQLFVRRPLFGWGLGNFIPAQGQLFFSRGTFDFYQPVHNLFLLILAEAGLLGLILAYFWGKRLWLKIEVGWRWMFFMIIFSGLFDHYWLTLQQNFLLLGIAIAITLVSPKDGGKEDLINQKPSFVSASSKA